MHTDAQECSKMRMGKNPTTFGKKPHRTRELKVSYQQRCSGHAVENLPAEGT